MRCWRVASMVFIGRRFRNRVGEQEPGRGGIPLRAHAPARERREHRRARRGGGGAQLGRWRLTNVLRRWRQICFQTMRTTIVSHDPATTSRRCCPSSCARRNFSTGSMSLGQVMQAASAFTIVQAAFNWLVDNYPRLADWTASARRVRLVDGVARCARTRGSR